MHPFQVYLTWYIGFVQIHKNDQPVEVGLVSTNAKQVHHRLGKAPQEANQLGKVNGPTHELGKRTQIQVNAQVGVVRILEQRQYLGYANGHDQFEKAEEFP